MRNVIYATIIAIVSWMVFGSMNELVSANKDGGCCGANNCGGSKFTDIIWWANVVIGIIATLTALYGFARMTKQGSTLPAIPYLPA